MGHPPAEHARATPRAAPPASPARSSTPAGPLTPRRVVDGGRAGCYPERVLEIEALVEERLEKEGERAAGVERPLGGSLPARGGGSHLLLVGVSSLHWLGFLGL